MMTAFDAAAVVVVVVEACAIVSARHPELSNSHWRKSRPVETRGPRLVIDWKEEVVADLHAYSYALNMNVIVAGDWKRRPRPYPGAECHPNYEPPHTAFGRSKREWKINS